MHKNMPKINGKTPCKSQITRKTFFWLHSTYYASDLVLVCVLDVPNDDLSDEELLVSIVWRCYQSIFLVVPLPLSLLCSCVASLHTTVLTRSIAAYHRRFQLISVFLGIFKTCFPNCIYLRLSKRTLVFIVASVTLNVSSDFTLV